MEYNRLGKTNLLISRVAFGGFRLSNIGNEDEAGKIVRKAYEDGINFFDTSKKVSESEKILGDALYDIRKNVFISTGTNAKTSSEIKQDLENRFWNLFNGGKIQYVKYPIDYNMEAIKTLIHRAMDMGFYEGVNLSLAYCDDCGDRCV